MKALKNTRTGAIFPFHPETARHRDVVEITLESHTKKAPARKAPPKKKAPAPAPAEQDNTDPTPESGDS